MRRREFISAIVGATAWPLAAHAQQPAMPLVGFLTEVPEALFGQPQLLAFLQGLGELGWVEGKKVAIDYRFGPELRQNARDLVRRNVSVIFATTPGAAVAAKDATTSIPIVALDLESDPVAKGYVKSLARPGGNLTG